MKRSNPVLWWVEKLARSKALSFLGSAPLTSGAKANPAKDNMHTNTPLRAKPLGKLIDPPSFSSINHLDSRPMRGHQG
jgi:hypothetical protein